MSILTEIKARKAYMAHVDGNRLSDAGKVEQADAKYRAALENYARAAEDRGCRSGYLTAYSVLLMRYRRFEEAMELLRRADKMPMSKQEKLNLRVNYAICQWKTGRLDAGIELMKSVFNDMKNSVVYGTLGYMLIEKGSHTGDFTEAVAFNREALEYDDEDAVVLDNLGQMHLRMGDRETALGYFERAHEEKPRQVDTLYYLGKLYAEQGRTEEAKELLETALRGNFSALCTTTREMARELYDSLGQ